MKAHFIKLFEYDRYANQLINTCLLTCNDEKAVQLMAHLLAAQQVWLSRCKGVPATGVALWPDWKSNTFAAIIKNNSELWLNFLNASEPASFETVIAYQSFKGDNFESKLIDILTHVINHSTHHRAQAGQHLKLAGVQQLPVTDYIYYLRNNV